ncbi:hypothetical protein RC52_16390 [Herbaspirillum rubrisubalbicans]|nr:hypothetical protein [Herbaspirillum rubrisubalbicans]
MKGPIFKIAFAIAATAALSPFIGIERVVGDHEMGVTWEPFIKHRPSLQFRFFNPVQIGLDFIPLNQLSPPERAAFKLYCEVRFGEADAGMCYTKLRERLV